MGLLHVYELCTEMYTHTYQNKHKKQHKERTSYLFSWFRYFVPIDHHRIFFFFIFFFFFLMLFFFFLEGKNDGSITDKTGKTVSYFECPANHGVFVLGGMIFSTPVQVKKKR